MHSSTHRKDRHEIVASIGSVSDLVSEIAHACSEQAEGIGQVSSSLAHLDRGAQKNTATAEQISGAAQRLANQMDSVKTSLAHFRTETS